MNSNKINKVIIFSLPLVGHTNPTLAVCKDLIKKHSNNVKIIFYSRIFFKDLIQEAGAEFRDYNTEIFEHNEKENQSNEANIFKFACRSIDLADKIATNLLNVILNEQPDLIIYDKAASFARLTIECAQNEYKKRVNLKPFKLICYSTTFLMDKDYPNANESKIFYSNLLVVLFYLLMYAFKKILFYFKHGIYNKNPTLKAASIPLSNETIITFTFPQLQPRSHLKSTNNKYKFVGCCLDEQLHSSGIDKINSNLSIINDDKCDLIYVSFGSIFQNQLNIYTKLIDSFKLVNEQKKIKVIMTTGSKCFEYLNQINYAVPSFVTLLRSAPQIEILKQNKVKLFITHSGMNSTSEAVHYGVPMICIPMALDQYLVANRVVELGLGVQLDKNCLNEIKIKHSILKILNDQTKCYKETCLLFKDYSRLSNGISNSVDVITTILNEN